jgi:hypothetical protein
MYLINLNYSYNYNYFKQSISNTAITLAGAIVYITVIFLI